MPSDNNGTPGAGDATATASDGAGTGTSTQSAQTPNARQEHALTEVIASLRTELVDMRREFRNKFAPAKPGEGGGTPTIPTTSSTVAAAPNAWDPTAILAFRDAIEEAGVIVNVPQRKMLEKLYRAEPGTADPVSWVREQTEILGWRRPVTNPAAPGATTVATAPTIKPPDIPPPKGTTAGENSIPDDPALLTQATIDQWTPEQALAHYKRWKQRNGAFRHPWEAAREAERASGQDLSHAAAALRQVLAAKK